MATIGAPGAAQAPTPEELQIFEQFKTEIFAQANVTEATVESVAVQIVSGKNYIFTVVAGDQKYKAVVYEKGAWDGGERSLTSVEAI
jgi:hypothetical protein